MKINLTFVILLILPSHMLSNNCVRQFSLQLLEFKHHLSSSILSHRIAYNFEVKEDLFDEDGINSRSIEWFNKADDLFISRKRMLDSASPTYINKIVIKIIQNSDDINEIEQLIQKPIRSFTMELPGKYLINPNTEFDLNEIEPIEFIDKEFSCELLSPTMRTVKFDVETEFLGTLNVLNSSKTLHIVLMLNQHYDSSEKMEIIKARTYNPGEILKLNELFRFHRFASHK